MATDAPKTGKNKPRRAVVRPERVSTRRWAGDLLTHPVVGLGLLIGAGFVLVASLVAEYARENPPLAIGRVMDETRLSRVEFTMTDMDVTERKRQEARARTPDVFRLDESAVNELKSSIESLPRTLAGVTSVDEVSTRVREQFQLTQPLVDAVKREAMGDEPGQAWLARTRELLSRLRQLPLVDTREWQRLDQMGPEHQVELLGDTVRTVNPAQTVSVGDGERLRAQAERQAREAGFDGDLLRVVVNRVTAQPRASFWFDEQETTRRQNQAASGVQEEITRVRVDQALYKRGEPLTEQQHARARVEQREFHNSAAGWRVWIKRLCVMCAVVAIAGAMGGYLALFCPKIRRNPQRVAGLAALLLGGMIVSCLGTVIAPAAGVMISVMPTVLASIVLAIVYDRRVALAIGVLQATLVGIALDQPVSGFAVAVTGIGTAAVHLKELRDRRSIVRVSVWCALGLAVATLLVRLVDRPIVTRTLVETCWDSLQGALAGLVTGGITMFVLPFVERAFGVTTGMTLIELRDPKHPLLKQLQQRAPGTYNHSLNVATIAEGAADAIGADSLLTYVGGLYHDIGKMNKPEYFVENQSGGPNKHDKLSPAMSLLVIVGHVKDGIEMAKEFGLPRAVHPFIEQHHGTTLVEYFFHRAKKKAEAEGQGEAEVREIEYRYPGPRPQIKEVAILMLADAVEGATRALSEPTPARIESLVDKLAESRLTDGQFDECDLTLRDLRQICDSISRTVASIYHGRVSYPSGERRA